MTETCSTELHNLLSEGGRELQNIKFLPGLHPSEEGICAEAARVIKSAKARDMPHNPPKTGKEKTRL